MNNKFRFPLNIQVVFSLLKRLTHTVSAPFTLQSSRLLLFSSLPLLPPRPFFSPSTPLSSTSTFLGRLFQNYKITKKKGKSSYDYLFPPHLNARSLLPPPTPPAICHPISAFPPKKSHFNFLPLPLQSPQTRDTRLIDLIHTSLVCFSFAWLLRLRLLLDLCVCVLVTGHFVIRHSSSVSCCWRNSATSLPSTLRFSCRRSYMRIVHPILSSAILHSKRPICD